MRFSKLILGLGGVGVVALSVHCGGEESGLVGGAATTSSNSASSSSGSGGGFTCNAPCCPAASCTAADKECIGLVDNKGKPSFGLRMAQLDITKPDALTSGIVAQIVGGAVIANNVACNLNGTATFNWLLQVDTAAQTIKTGGAKPVADMTKGYDFVNEPVAGIPVAPITFNAKIEASGAFTITTGQDLVVPIYLDKDAKSVVVLPLKQAKFDSGTISASQNCIGHYNAEGLKPEDSCIGPDEFVTAASLSGMITLEDADTVTVTSLNQSLCVLLSGSASTYGEKNTAGVTVCKRNADGKIIFEGDSCYDVTTPGCKDSVALTASFAASSVLINN
jgi:hypothetical protein